MFKLTSAQSEQINSAEYTHDYSSAANWEIDNRDCDPTEKYEELFEKSTNVKAASTKHDLGGIAVYVRGNGDLVAFYDYEQFVGTVFLPV